MTKTFKCICFGMIYLNMVKDTEKIKYRKRNILFIDKVSLHENYVLHVTPK